MQIFVVMKPEKPLAPKKNTPTNPGNEAKKVEHAAKIKKRNIAKTGLTTRIKGHVSARTKRVQGKRDSR